MSVALSAYEVGRLFLLGHTPDGRVSLYERSYPRCMGLHASKGAFYMGSLAHLWKFQDFGTDHAIGEGYDAAYVPTRTWTVGDLDIHDVCLNASGELVFAATSFNCVAALSETASFRPVWRPPFIGELVNEDRCHLNGLCCGPDGSMFVTAFSKTDFFEGWRGTFASQGFLYDVKNEEFLVENLCMPHSPRLLGADLYVLESGRGMLKKVDPKTGQSEDVAFIPGYCRGLAIMDRYAVVACSTERDGRSFDDLPLADTLSRANRTPACGIFVVNLKTGAIEHYFQMTGAVSQIFDVCILDNCKQPMLYGTAMNDLKMIVKPELNASAPAFAAG